LHGNNYLRESDCATTKRISNIIVASAKAVFPAGSEGLPHFGRLADGRTADLLRKHGGKTGDELKAEGK
jgi:hypothetical protein